MIRGPSPVCLFAKRLRQTGPHSTGEARRDATLFLAGIALETLPIDGVFDSAADFLVRLAGTGDGQPEERGMIRLV